MDSVVHIEGADWSNALPLEFWARTAPAEQCRVLKDVTGEVPYFGEDL